MGIIIFLVFLLLCVLFYSFFSDKENRNAIGEWIEKIDEKAAKWLDKKFPSDKKFIRENVITPYERASGRDYIANVSATPSNGDDVHFDIQEFSDHMRNTVKPLGEKIVNVKDMKKKFGNIVKEFDMNVTTTSVNGTTTVTINGKTTTVNGGNVSITNGKIFVDGKPIAEGEDYKTDAIVINGNVGSITTDSTSVSVVGTVKGDVIAGTSVACDDINGNVRSGTSVSCGNVKGDVHAGGSVSCDDVGGSVNAGGSVVHG